MKPPATTLGDARFSLYRDKKALDPSLKSDRALYVERARDIHADLISKAVGACENDEVFRWFFTGHMGAGKSTELNQIIHDPSISGRYITHNYLVKERLDVQNLQFLDLVLAIGQSVVEIADKHSITPPPELNERLEAWGKDTTLITELGMEGKAKGGFDFRIFMMKAEAEVGVGGGKKKIVQEKLFDSLTVFIQLINDFCKVIEEKTQKKILVVMDTLDHVDDQHIIDIFTKHYGSLTKTNVSLLIVIPLRLLHEKEFMAANGRNYSPLPNIKVYRSAEDTSIDPGGYEFFKQVIVKLADLALFSPEALEKIFLLSCGMIREMIGLAGEACEKAFAENPSGKVELGHVEKVMDANKAHFRRVLTKSDYEILNYVKTNPRIKGMDGVGPLLHLKAVVFYPNGEGWYGLHPAVDAILNDS